MQSSGGTGDHQRCGNYGGAASSGAGGGNSIINMFGVAAAGGHGMQQAQQNQDMAAAMQLTADHHGHHHHTHHHHHPHAHTSFQQQHFGGAAAAGHGHGNSSSYADMAPPQHLPLQFSLHSVQQQQQQQLPSFFKAIAAAAASSSADPQASTSAPSHLLHLSSAPHSSCAIAMAVDPFKLSSSSSSPAAHVVPAAPHHGHHHHPHHSTSRCSGSSNSDIASGLQLDSASTCSAPLSWKLGSNTANLNSLQQQQASHHIHQHQDLSAAAAALPFILQQWTSDETAALIKLRSEMIPSPLSVHHSSVFLWEELTRKLQEMGYQRSPQECKEKMESIQKLYRKGKDEMMSQEGEEAGGGGEDQLEFGFSPEAAAEGGHASSSSRGPHRSSLQLSTHQQTPDHPLNSHHIPRHEAPPSMVDPNLNLLHPLHINIDLDHSRSIVMYAGAPTPPKRQRFLDLDDDDDDDDDDDAAADERRRGDGAADDDADQSPWLPSKRFFEKLTRKIMAKQERLHRAFLEAIERRDRERMAREEEQRRKEAARASREQEIRAHELAVAAARDSALIAFLEKATGHTLQAPAAVGGGGGTYPRLALPMSTMTSTADASVSPHSPPPSSVHHLLAAPPASALHHLAVAAGPSSVQHHLQLANLQGHGDVAQQHHVLLAEQLHQQHLAETTSSSFHLLQSLDAAAAAQSAADSNTRRWPKVEVHALIRLRSGMEPRFREAGPKAHLWQEISASMACLGFARSPKRCKEKWENINKYFKKTKDSSKKRPENAKTCPYFHQLDTLYERGILSSSTAVAASKQATKPGADDASASQVDYQHHKGGALAEMDGGFHMNASGTGEEDEGEEDEDEDDEHDQNARIMMGASGGGEGNTMELTAELGMKQLLHHHRHQVKGEQQMGGGGIGSGIEPGSQMPPGSSIFSSGGGGGGGTVAVTASNGMAPQMDVQQQFSISHHHHEALMGCSSTSGAMATSSGSGAATKKSMQVEMFVKDVLDLQQQQHQKLVEEYDRMEQAHELRELERQQHVQQQQQLQLQHKSTHHDSLIYGLRP